MAHEIRIPRLGWSMEVGTFLGWRKKDGDPVTTGEPLFELEGEKAAQEIEALEAGVLRIAPDSPAIGAEVSVGRLIGYVVDAGEADPFAHEAEESPAPDVADAVFCDEEVAQSARPLSPSARRRARELGLETTPRMGTGKRGRVTRQDIEELARQTVEQAVSDAASSLTSARIKSSPRARRVAQELDIDWQQLTGSGRDGRVREADVRAAAGGSERARAQEPAEMAVPVASTPVASIVPHTKLRRVIARRMLSSHRDTAPVTLTTQANAANLVNLRAQFKATGEPVIPSLNDLIVKLVADVLLRHPRLAARWEEDRLVLPADEQLAIGLAVDTEEGLLVPVLRRVPQTPLIQLARESLELVRAAREGRLTLEQLQDAHFTVTNLGSFGIDAFTPVINTPEAAILGVGAIRREAIVQEDDRIVSGLRMTLSLTFDHRVVDGAPAAKFLAELRDAIENPVPRLV